MPDASPSTADQIAASPAKPRRTGFKPAPLPDRVTVTVDGARIVSGLSLSKLRELVLSGELRSRMVAGRRLIYFDSLMELLHGGPVD